MSEATAAVKELDSDQRARLGTGGLAIGIALIGVLGFAPVDSTVLQVILGIMGVLILVAGVLLVGTSRGSV